MTTANPITLPTARLLAGAGGTPMSAEFGDVYHSADGATEQARHVFIAGNDLPQRWRGRDRFTIVETGFGLGLNFLETWRAIDDDPHAPQMLHFVSVENRPLAREAVASVLSRWPEHADRARELARQWPLPLAGFHRLAFKGGRIVLTLLFGDAAEALGQLEANADALYLDGFSPARNPAAWSPAVCRELARLATADCTLATWTVASSVRRALADAGFALEKRPGFGSKHEMLVGRLRPNEAREGNPGIAVERRALIKGAGVQRSAVILGAGIAGCSLAERLVARGWRVEVIERHAGPAMEASGNPLALASPLVNPADSENAQLSRAAFLYALEWYGALGHGCSPTVTGVLRIARTARDVGRFEQMLHALAYPPALAAFADAEACKRLAGHPVGHAGLWFPQGFAVSPAEACIAALARCGDGVRVRTGIAAARVVESHGGWKVFDERDSVIAEAPIVIIAGGTGSKAISGRTDLPLESLRGQVTLLPPGSIPRLGVAVSGDRHAVLLPDGQTMIGATFQDNDDDASVRASDHADNMASVERMLPGLCESLKDDLSQLAGRTGFRAVTPDRLPAYGAIAASKSGHPLYLASGLGARGIVWAPLCAELLASQLNGDPWPVSRHLAQAIDPIRFISR
jgi:tRNA 5-methylaminomethyl-2-thiouridine biosynthesis bifunctional protein